MFQYFFEFKLNGKVVHRVENENPLTFNDVEVWASKGAYRHVPADAYIEDLRYGDPAGTSHSTQCTVSSRVMSQSCPSHGPPLLRLWVPGARRLLLPADECQPRPMDRGLRKVTFSYLRPRVF